MYETQQPLLLNIPQVMQLLGLSRSKIYKLIRSEGLPVVRFGRAVRISPIALQQWINQRE
jgi:excisionase family DNA binding protein